jgi:transposase InsO family protein
LKRDAVLKITGMTKHQYYYKPRQGHRGKRPAVRTLKRENSAIVEIPDTLIVEQLTQLKQTPDTNYGYKKMTYLLMLLGFYINHKKVYRLMKQNNLLLGRSKRPKRMYAQYRIVIPEQPLHVLEMDIKMVWVASLRRHAYILTVLDTFTRTVLLWRSGLQMTQHQIKSALERVIIDHLQPADLLAKGVHIEIRNDNGPQFSAAMIQQYLSDNSLCQVFTHPYTPQENGHIESFHSILASYLDRFSFWSIDQLNSQLTLFYDRYNNQRIHASIAYLYPMLFWELWDKGMVDRHVNPQKKVKFTLKIPYQEISGITSLKEVSCLKARLLNGGEILHEAIGPETLQTTSVHHSPSVVSCFNKNMNVNQMSNVL